MNTTINLKDKFQTTDKYSISISDPKQKSFLRTSISAGYDDYIGNGGYTELGEVLFEEKENMVVLGGSLFTAEKLFNIKSPLLVEYLNDIMGIATTGPAITETYPKETGICLFGVGIGGCGDSMTDVKDVKYYDREIINMIPLRLTDKELSVDDLEKYWFRKPIGERTAYYLKTFESTPEIRVLWRDVEGEDGSNVQQGVHNTPPDNKTDIDTFVEIILKVNKRDVREYFEVNGNVESTRVNSIGLFTGIKADIGDGKFDYKQVKLFSKLNIHNEMLVLDKDMTIIYRIFLS